MERRALIGVVCQHSQENPERYFIARSYIQAVQNAGGTPLVLPIQPQEDLSQVLEHLDGIVLTGGVDVDPYRFGEDPLVGCGEINPLRDEFDLAVTALALERDLPILAICRGAQVLNVALGGSLIQDIPTQVQDPIKHWQQAPNWYATHNVEVKPDSLLGEILETQLTRVNSYHHQSIAKPGQGLSIVATAPDGVIEAVESTEHRFVLGLQWHPELMVERDVGAQAIFKHFVRAALAK